jgi:hypothetical protein
MEGNGVYSHNIDKTDTVEMHMSAASINFEPDDETTAPDIYLKSCALVVFGVAVFPEFFRLQ